MKKKMATSMILVFLLMVGFAAANTYAFDSRGKGKMEKMDLEEKFFHKAHLILSCQEEIGLAEEQAKKVKELKTNTKKDLIRKNAEIEILGMDIESALREDVIDTKAVNKLIDKKYDFKKEKAKILINAYAALKDSLSKEQKEKLKEVWKKCEKEQMSCSMLPGMEMDKGMGMGRKMMKGMGKGMMNCPMMKEEVKQ